MIKTVYLSSNTNKMIQSNIDKYIDKYSVKFDVSSSLIRAIIYIESRGDITAIRYEPQLKKAKWYNKNLSFKNKKDDFTYCSYGLMQILFATAKALGYKGTPINLYNIKDNIYYGTKYIKNLIKRYGNTEDVISSYNQGTPKKNAKGKYKNQQYVNAVSRHMRKLLKIKYNLLSVKK